MKEAQHAKDAASDLCIAADFTQRAVSHARSAHWLPSPMPGVERLMLDRIGGEVARATSLVRYAPESRFPAHRHDGGEEFLVLEGVFQDENGDYPAGTYIRNPPGSSHAPRSDVGCLIFVKLHQFAPGDRLAVRQDGLFATMHASVSAPEPLQLHRNDQEEVWMERWPAGANLARDCLSGLEILVIEGSFRQEAEVFERHSWLRCPPGDRFAAVAGPEGATVFVKTGHLAHKVSFP